MTATILVPTTVRDAGAPPLEIRAEVAEVADVAEVAEVAEQQRQAACAAANKDWADKDCANRRIGNPPSDNQDINFNFPAPGVGGADFMSGSVFEFQRALYNDVTDGT